MGIAHPFAAGNFAWINGRLEEVDPQTAIKLPLMCQALDYARLVISGMRVTPHHADPGKLLIFSLHDHVARIFDSCERLGLELAQTQGEIFQALVEVVRANGPILGRGGYLRAIAFDARQILSPQTHGPASVVIFAGPFGEYISQGDFKVTFDHWLRLGQWGRVKAASNYVRFSAARGRAVELGMDDSLGVTIERGGRLVIGEGTTSNAFFVFDHAAAGNGRFDCQIVTPPLDAGILAGITRMRTLEFAQYLGYEAIERDVALSEVPLAREIWVTGTASYVAPFKRLGRHLLEKTIGGQLNGFLRRVMRGEEEHFAHLNTVVPVEAPVEAG